MTHIGGYPGNYDRRGGKEVQRLRPGLFICGHSHILNVMRDQALDLVHMNPGACGHNGWHLARTLLRFTVESGRYPARRQSNWVRAGGQPPEKRVERRNRYLMAT
jgi:hypothetical protein